MRRRVLIVVSSYRPAMLADMQRARMLAWELPKLGWDVEILTPAASEVRQDAIEPDADGFFAADVPVHEVRAWVRQAFQLLGLRSPAWRTWLPMYWRGRALLGSGRFDLVYLSTTLFNFFLFGPLWQRECAVPYVLDFQDPWVRSESGARNWKERLSRALAPSMERAAVAGAAGLVAVSDGYLAALKDRYDSLSPGWMHPSRHAVIPFGALELDLDEAQRLHVVRPRNNDEIRLGYVGAGAMMGRSFSLICRALRHLQKHGEPLAGHVRIDLLGTGAPGTSVGRRVLHDVAREAGVGDLVAECTERVSYRRSLETMLDSDGLLILGVDDPAYIPSKLFGYALSGQPILASVRGDGPAFALFDAAPELGSALWFDGSRTMPVQDAAAVVRSFLGTVKSRTKMDRGATLAPHLAPAMARRHAQLFEAVRGATTP